jgi:hypothetical protein
MNEQEWLECADSGKMLEFLEGKVSDRKLRLFAAICVSRLWDVVDYGEEHATERCRASIELVERCAEGKASMEELRAARLAVQEVASRMERHRGEWWPIDVALATTEPEAAVAARETVTFLGNLEKWAEWQRNIVEAGGGLIVFGRTALARTIEKERAREKNSPWLPKWEACLEQWDVLTSGSFWTQEAAKVRREVRAMLHEHFGNPFRPVPFDPAWRTPSVLAVAQTIYDDRRFNDLSILADALEEAGCTSEDLLAHCRSKGEHVRGCWSVDLVLARE